MRRIIQYNRIQTYENELTKLFLSKVITTQMSMMTKSAVANFGMVLISQLKEYGG